MTSWLRFMSGVVIPAILWVITVLFLRPQWTRFDCVQDKASCSIGSIPEWERFAVELHSLTAQRVSDYLQNGSGVLLWIVAFLCLRRLKCSAVFSVLWGMTLTLGFAIWNGLLMDWVRMGVQRPRPYVFTNLEVFGNSVSDYTSFYSGHTSFTCLLYTSPSPRD